MRSGSRARSSKGIRAGRGAHSEECVQVTAGRDLATLLMSPFDQDLLGMSASQRRLDRTHSSALLPDVDAELPALLVQVAPLEPEAARGVGHVAAVGAQALADDVALVGVQDLPQGAVGPDRAPTRGGGRPRGC